LSPLLPELSPLPEELSDGELLSGLLFGLSLPKRSLRGLLELPELLPLLATLSASPKRFLSGLLELPELPSLPLPKRLPRSNANTLSICIIDGANVMLKVIIAINVKVDFNFIKDKKKDIIYEILLINISN
jgi:hypothetical protein